MAERGRHRAGAGAHDREPRRPRQAVRCPEPTRAGPTNTHPSLPDGLSRPASAVLRRCNGTIHTVRPPGTRPGGRRSATRGASRSCVPPGVIHSLRCAAPMLSTVAASAVGRGPAAGVDEKASAAPPPTPQKGRSWIGATGSRSPRPVRRCSWWSRSPADRRRCSPSSRPGRRTPGSSRRVEVAPRRSGAPLELVGTTDAGSGVSGIVIDTEGRQEDPRPSKGGGLGDCPREIPRRRINETAFWRV
jgi:hypothetical protein